LSAANDDLPVAVDQGVPPEPLLAGADRPVVPDLTERVLAAGVDTRVAAVVVEAGETVGALVVVLALPSPAEDKGVSLVPGWALALGRVSGRETLSVGTAGVWIAGVGLLLAASDGVRGRDVAADTLTHRVTGTVGAALSVGATGAGRAGVRRWSHDPHHGAPSDGVGLRGVAGQAGADWVTLPVLSALSVWTAGTGRAGVRSRGAPVVITDISRPTVRVHLALSLTPGDCVRHRYEASQAAADGIALSVLHTPRVGPTGGGITRVRPDHTSLALTDVASLTVRVSHTLRATPGDCVGLGDEAGLTPTDWVASKVDSADGSRTTGTWNTGIRLLHTSLALTDVAAATVRIHQALRTTACDGVGVGDETWLTSTDGVARPGQSTVSSRTTRGRVTWIGLLHTLLVLTDEASATVWVSDTLGFTTCDGVGVGDETWLTSTDGIARPGQSALSSRTTGRGVAGIWLDNTSLALTDVASLTVRVSHALRATPGDCVGLGDEAGLTGADSVASMVDITHSSGTTGAGLTRVGFLCASVCPADKSHPAVWVNDTLRLAASDGVRVGSVAGHTATHGVPISVHVADCPGAAGRGTAGVRGPGTNREMAGASTQSVVEDHGGAGELSGCDTAVHGAPTGDVALQAGTDGITLVVDHTVGQLPTW